jgi:hypothetical protein
VSALTCVREHLMGARVLPTPLTLACDPASSCFSSSSCAVFVCGECVRGLVYGGVCMQNSGRRWTPSPFLAMTEPLCQPVVHAEGTAMEKVTKIMRRVHIEFILTCAGRVMTRACVRACVYW